MQLQMQTDRDFRLAPGPETPAPNKHMFTSLNNRRHMRSLLSQCEPLF